MGACHDAAMCGRYRLLRRMQILSEHFDATPFDDDWIPRHDIARTQPLLHNSFA